MDIKLSQGEIFNIKNSTGETVLSVGSASTDTIQEKLVSGTNIKTVNGSSILGSGNLDAGNVFEAGTGQNSAVQKGGNNSASGASAVAEGSGTTASGQASHAEGIGENVDLGFKPIYEATTSRGYRYRTSTGNAHLLRIGDIVDNNAIVTYVESSSSAKFTVDKQIDTSTNVYRRFGHSAGSAGHSEGKSIVIGDISHSEGNLTVAIGNNSHSEGKETQAWGNNSHAEGIYTYSLGVTSHAEGYKSKTGGDSTQNNLTKGDSTESGAYAHAEGNANVAVGVGSHAEGEKTFANGVASHAEGRETTASGQSSHAEGCYTIAKNASEHAEGYYNVSNSATTTYGSSGNTQHSVGIGSGSGTIPRKNAFEIMQNGDAYFYGVGGYDGTNATASTSSTLQEVIGDIETLLSQI